VLRNALLQLLHRWKQGTAAQQAGSNTQALTGAIHVHKGSVVATLHHKVAKKLSRAFRTLHQSTRQITPQGARWARSPSQGSRQIDASALHLPLSYVNAEKARLKNNV
jgi:hypothetical protein